MKTPTLLEAFGYTTRAPLETVKGMYVHVAQGWVGPKFPTPHQVQQARQSGKPMKWDDVDPKAAEMVTISSEKKAGPNEYVFKVEMDGTLSNVGSSVDSSD